MTVVGASHDAETMQKLWAEHAVPIPLEIVHSRTRSFSAATLAFIDELERRWENTDVTVVIPEFYVRHWWQHLLHNTTELVLKGHLLFRKGTVVTSIPYGGD